jgi:hypothetical protein
MQPDHEVRVSSAHMESGSRQSHQNVDGLEIVGNRRFEGQDAVVARHVECVDKDFDLHGAGAW